MSQLSAEALQWKQRAEERQARIVELEALLEVAEKFVTIRALSWDDGASYIQRALKEMREEFEKNEKT